MPFIFFQSKEELLSETGRWKRWKGVKTWFHFCFFPFNLDWDLGVKSPTFISKVIESYFSLSNSLQKSQHVFRAGFLGGDFLRWEFRLPSNRWAWPWHSRQGGQDRPLLVKTPLAGPRGHIDFTMFLLETWQECPHLVLGSGWGDWSWISVWNRVSHTAAEGQQHSGEAWGPCAQSKASKVLDKWKQISGGTGLGVSITPNSTVTKVTFSTQSYWTQRTHLTLVFLHLQLFFSHLYILSTDQTLVLGLWKVTVSDLDVVVLFPFNIFYDNLDLKHF
jgi:hypothetical protein